jgi:hypothetical protein
MTFCMIASRLKYVLLSYTVYVNDRSAMDACVELTQRTPGCDESKIALFASTTEMADFVWVREYEEWLARAHDEDNRWMRVCVTSDGCGPNVRDGEAPTNTEVLINYDFPSSTAKYRSRAANVFANDADDRQSFRRREIVISIVTADDLEAFRTLRQDVPFRNFADFKPLHGP